MISCFVFNIFHEKSRVHLGHSYRGDEFSFQLNAGSNDRYHIPDSLRLESSISCLQLAPQVAPSLHNTVCGIHFRLDLLKWGSKEMQWVTRIRNGAKLLYDAFVNLYLDTLVEFEIRVGRLPIELRLNDWVLFETLANEWTCKYIHSSHCQKPAV
jgi:hypothetical protein